MPPPERGVDFRLGFRRSERRNLFLALGRANRYNLVPRDPRPKGEVRNMGRQIHKSGAKFGRYPPYDIHNLAR